jgi:hypothetical protein
VEAGKGDKVAYHWRGEEGEERDVTYADLLGDVQKLANALKDLGIERGDVVGIYLPMIPEVVVAMLPCGSPDLAASPRLLVCKRLIGQDVRPAARRPPPSGLLGGARDRSKDRREAPGGLRSTRSV